MEPGAFRSPGYPEHTKGPVGDAQRAFSDLRCGQGPPPYGMNVNFADPFGAVSHGQKLGALRGRAFALTSR